MTKKSLSDVLKDWVDNCYNNKYGLTPDEMKIYQRGYLDCIDYFDKDVRDKINEFVVNVVGRKVEE